MFSEVHGYLRLPIQYESMTVDLKNSLWNVFDECIMSILVKCSHDHATDINKYLTECLGHFFKLSISDYRHVRPIDNIHTIHRNFNNLEWNRVYDFMEFILKMFGHYFGKASHEFKVFKDNCNYVLECENTAYRFVDTSIIEITSNEEIATVEESMKENDADPAAAHISNAVVLLSNKEKPNYRMVCHESISAVEAIAQKITGKKNAVLSDLIGSLPIHSQFRMALNNIYNYTSGAEGGIRHAIKNLEVEINHADAIYMLVLCSAFVNFIKAKQKLIIRS